MSSTLANMTMDDVKTVNVTANSISKLAAVPDECTLEAQVSNPLMDQYTGPLPWDFSVRFSKTLSY